MPALTNPFILALKAGLAVSLALLLARFSGNPDALSAGFAALACTTPVVSTGMRRGFEQLAGSLAGGVVSALLLLALPNQPWVAGLAAFVTVLLIFRLALAGTYLIAGFTVLYVFFVPAENPAEALETRLLALACGVGAATLVNVVVSASAYRSIFARRVQVVRLAVVDAYRTLAHLTESQPTRAPQAFDAAAPLLWTLAGELSDAARESTLPHAADAGLDTPHRLVRALESAMHLGRELGYLAAAEPRLAPDVTRAARDLLATLVDGTQVPEFIGDSALATIVGRARTEAAEIHRLGLELGRRRGLVS